MERLRVSPCSLLLVWILTPVCFAATVQFFEEPDFKGYMYVGISTRSCTNLPDYARNCSGSIKTTGCVAVYERQDCFKSNEFGFVFTLEERNLTSFPILRELPQVASYRDCTDLERDTQIHVDFLKIDLSPFLQFRNVCTCTQLPKSIISPANNTVLRTYGKCITSYSDEKCLKQPWSDGKEGETGIVNVGYFKSFKPCHWPQHCVSTNAVIAQLEPLNDLPSLQNLTNTVTIGATETFRNNGGATLEEEYSVEKDIEENYQFGFAKEFSQMNSISFDVGVKIGVKSSFMGGLVSASAEIQEGLSTKYQSTSSSTETKGYGVKRTTKFKVEKKIIIPACTEYKVGSSVKVATDVVINYRVEYKINGIIQSGIKMKASDLREYLGDMKYVRDVDEFTVLAETTAMMKATFGLETFTDAKGTIIDPCVRAKKALLCKPKRVSFKNQP